MNLLLIVLTAMQTTMNVSSPAFEEGKTIPQEYSCQGLNNNPPLTFSQIPGNTVSLVLFMEDPDAPGGGFDHWVMFNIPPVAGIKSGEAPGTEGLNTKGDTKYTGPCPPTGVHHYHFKVYALDTKLDLEKGASKANVIENMKGHVLASGELMGVYTKDSESLYQQK